MSKSFDYRIPQPTAPRELAYSSTAWSPDALVERLGPLLGPALVARLAEERKALESSERYWLTPWVIGGAHIWDALYPAERAAIAWAIEAWKAEGPFE